MRNLAWAYLSIVGVGFSLSGCNLKKLFHDPRCYTAADCDASEICSAYLCAQPGSIDLGRYCWASRDCKSGNICGPSPKLDNVSRCLPAGKGDVGDTCQSDFDCNAQNRCAQSGFVGSCTTAGKTDINGSCSSNLNCMSGLFCGESKTCNSLYIAFPPFLGVTCSDSGAFRAYFEVPSATKTLSDFFRFPYPNDGRKDANGKLELSDFPRPGPTPLGPDLVALYADTLVNEFDGFSAVAPVTFRFSAAVDPTTLSANTTFVDVTSGPSFGTKVTTTVSFKAESNKYACKNRVIASVPLNAVLTASHTYALYLTTGVLSTSGQAAAADKDLVSVLSGTRPSEDAVGRTWDAYAQLRAYLSMNRVDVGSVAAATVFTVGDTTGHMQRLAAAAAAQPAPQLKNLVLCANGVTSPCADGTAQRTCGSVSADFFEIHGRFTVPIFQQGDEPYATPDNGGGIKEVQGVPQVVRSEDVCFALTVPKQMKPLSGWPLMVYHHGTGGSYTSFIGEGVADQMATLDVPTAVFSFDAVEHGARRGASTDKPDNLVFNVLNPYAARDNMLQGAVDILQAFRVAGLTIAPSLTGSAVGFDHNRVLFFGHSQGSNSGPMALAYSSATSMAILSGAGSGVTYSLLDKTSPVNISRGIAFLLGDTLDENHPTMTLFQNFFDRSDPVNIEPLLIRLPPMGVSAKNILQTYGSSDTFTPPRTLHATAASIGLPVVRPLVDPMPVSDLGTIDRPVTRNLTSGNGSKVTGALFQYDSGGNFDGHFAALISHDAILDWSAFVLSWLQTQTALVQ